MSILDRKERNWASREHLILEHADDLIRQHGYLGLNLDHLADRIEYSKATIYNHFSTKEDLLLGVTNLHLQTRKELFSRALTYDGLSRERGLALGVADITLAQQYPHGFPLFQLLQNPSIWEKTSEEHQKVFANIHNSCIQISGEVIRQARALGDLPASAPADSQILFGIISLSKGAHLLAQTSHTPFTTMPGFPWEALMANYHVFLDGVGWRPLQGDFDYVAAETRVRTTLFAQEAISPAHR